MRVTRPKLMSSSDPQVSLLNKEKYRSEAKFRLTQLRRLPILRALRNLTRWEPLDNPAEGYSIIIGCNTRLARMLSCNLKYLVRQDLSHLAKILIIFDRPREEMPDDIEAVISSRFPTLPIEVLYYTKLQERIASALHWPSVQAWLSWSIGIGRLETQYGFLHDFDAMLLRADMIEERFRTICERGDEYLGIRFYEGHGLVPDDELATTFELMFDAQFVRREFVPLDLFNHVARFRGRRVDFDTFLYAQSRRGKASTAAVAEEDLVHPSQLITEFENLLGGLRSVPHDNNLLLVPYFLFAAQEPDVMVQLTQDLENGAGSSVSFFGKALELSAMAPDRFRWIVKQAYRLERSDSGCIRDAVRRYFVAADKFIARAGKRDSVLDSSEAEIERELGAVE